MNGRQGHGRRLSNFAQSCAVSIAVAAAYLGAIGCVFASNVGPSVLNPTFDSFQNTAAKVDGNTGALTEQIHLDIPPGRNGLQPDLSLQYNSQNTDQDSIVGYGWSLSIPYIERLNKTGSQTLYNSDAYFTSSMDGELATTSTSTIYTFRARVDDGGTFRSYTYSTSTNSWTVYDKSGTEYLFGSSAQSQQYATSTQVYKWMLEKEIDTNGNYVRYVYRKDSNQIYPYQILYTGSGVSDGPLLITLSTTTRSDTVMSFKPGFEVDTNYLISTITAAVNGANVRQYSLTYANGNNGARSLLSSVQETGWNDANTQTTLPSWTFSYVSSSTPFVTAYEPNSGCSDAYVAADVDGNGRNDAARISYSAFTTNTSGSIDPDGVNGTTFTPPGQPNAYWAYSNGTGGSTTCSSETGTRFVDTNADGKADVVQSYYDTSLHSSYYANTTASGSYSWTSTSTIGTIPPFEVHPTGSNQYTAGLFSDLNGDGLPDFTFDIPNASYGSSYNGAYFGNGSAWNTATTTIFVPPYQLPVGSSDCTNSQLVDVNGDGLPDWVYTDGSNTYTRLNTGTGWESSADTRWTIATSTVFNSAGTCYDRGMRFVDVNGDGLPDFIRSYINTGNAGLPETGTSTLVYLNIGHGWATSTAYTLPYIINGSAGNVTYQELTNFQGNGQQDQDIISNITYPKGGSTDVTYGYTAGSDPQLPYNLIVVTKLVNHDGRGSNEETDYAYSGGKQYLPTDVFDRKFAGFYTVTATSSNAVTTTYYDQGDTIATSSGEQSDGYAQINHPFRQDIFNLSDAPIQRTYYRWDADVESPTTNTVTFPSSNLIGYWKFDESSGAASDSSSNGYTLTNDNTVSYVSGKINNAASFVAASNQYFNAAYNVSPSITGSHTVAFWLNLSSLPLSGGSPYYLVAKTTGSGSASADSYDGPELFLQNNSGTQNIWLYFSGTTNQNTNVCGVSVSWTPATSTWYQIAYTYNASSTTNNVLFYVNGSQQGTTQSCTLTGSQLLNASINDFSVGALKDSFAPANTGSYLNGKMDELGVWNRALAGSDISNLYNSGSGISYAAAITPSTYTFLHLGSQITESFNSDGSHTDKATTYTYATSTDNLTQQNDYGQVTAASDGTFTDTGIDQRTTRYSYAASSSVNMYLPYEKTLLNASSSTTTDTRFYYDNLALGSVNVGNQTKEEDLISGSSYASSTKTYNAYGLVATSTDPLSHSTAYLYDSFNMYPATTTNPLSQKTGYLYNYSNGKVKQTNDPNGKVTQDLFDGVGRTTQANVSDVSTPSSLDTKTAYAYTDNTSTPSLVHESDYLTSATSSDTYNYYDGLGRLLQERRSTENAASSSVIDHIYNAAGLEGSTSLPYFSAGTSFTSPTTTLSLYSAFTYDPLQRTTKITTNVGSTTHAYGGWVATSTDPDGNVTAQILDAYGNLAQVNDVNSTTTYQTLYSYDAANNLTKLTDANGNVRNFTYDGLNRRLTAQDLHAPSNNSFGTWTYAYDLSGNVASSSDPKSQEVDYTYDALNRPLTENFVASSTLTSYTYDSCTNGIGHLCTASSTGAQMSYAYDILGRTSSATTTIAGTAYNTSYAYDFQDNPTSIVYPDGRTVSYGYNNAGLVSEVSTKASGGSTFSTLAGPLAYAPTRALSDMPFTNGFDTAYTYDPLHLYRLQRLLSETGATTTSSGTFPSSNLIGYWKFDESSGAASDSSSNGYTLTNDNTVSYVSGKINNAASFVAASNQYFNAAYNVSPSMTGSHTVAFWLDLSSLPSSGQVYQLVAKTTASGSASADSYDGTELFLQNNSGTQNIWLYLSGTTNQNTNDCGVSVSWTPATSTWYQIAYTYNASSTTNNVLFYVNGSQQGTTQSCTLTGSQLLNSTINDFSVGARKDSFASANTGQYLDGKIDELGVWNRALAGSEVSTLYNGGLGLTYGTTTTYSNVAADLNYTYDALGNILTLLNNSTSGTSLTASFTYDPLNRLTSASTTAAASNPYSQTYAYDTLGDITNKSDIGSYTYSSSGSQDPNAPTSINGVTQTYDLDGNLITASPWSYGWDYRNRLVNATNGSASSTYAYDYQNNRVLQITASSTSYYPSKYYSISATTTSGTTNATSTDYIYLPGPNGGADQLIAEAFQRLVNGTATGTPTTYYVHTDNLGSIAALTDASGTPQQALDYYPYGSQRVASSSPGVDAARKYIGQFSDPTSLDYLNARYYNPAQGQFFSEDPLFLGTPKQQNLGDPQSLNSYSYSEGNPIVKSDPTGKQLSLAASYGTGYLLGGETGPLDLIVGTALGTTLFLAAESSPQLTYEPTAPGYPQVFQESIGQGYHTDPELGGDLPPGWWGRIIKTGLVLGGTATALKEGGWADLIEAFDQAPKGAVSQLPSPEMVTTLGKYFPLVLSQNGTTYYRNYTGLLSSTPPLQSGGSYQTSSGKSTSASPTYPGGTIFPIAPELHAIIPQ